MAGTQTMSAGGTISGGSDSYTWDQRVDNLVVVGLQGGGQSPGSTVAGSSPLYYLGQSDEISQSLHDVGDDVLGASDSILAGSDSYTWIKSRGDSSNVTDLGTSANPYSVFAEATDGLSSKDVGGSSVSGAFSEASDCYTYIEQSSDDSASSQSEAETSYDQMFSGGVIATGRADDYYSNADVGTIFSSGATTSSNDAFTVDSSHEVTGVEHFSAAESSHDYGYDDTGVERSNMYAQGSRGTGSQDYSFHEGSYRTDNGASSDTVSGSSGYSIVSGSGETTSQTENGDVSGSSGQWYSFGSQDNSYSSEGYNGSYFGAGGVFNGTSWSSESLSTVETSPPPSSTTYAPYSASYSSYFPSSAPNGYGTGNQVAVYAPGATAANVGTPKAGAMHMGTGGGTLDDSSGLLSALGGEDAQGLDQTSPEMDVELIDGDMEIEDGGSEWQSAPGEIGYRRPGGVSSEGSSGGGISDALLDGLMSNGTAAGSGSNLTGLLNEGVDGDAQRGGVTQARPLSLQEMTQGEGASGGVGSGGPVFTLPQMPQVSQVDGSSGGSGSGGPLWPSFFSGLGSFFGSLVGGNNGGGNGGPADQGSPVTGPQPMAPVVTPPPTNPVMPPASAIPGVSTPNGSGFSNLLGYIYDSGAYTRGDALDSKIAARRKAASADPLDSSNGPLRAGSIPRISGDSTDASIGRAKGAVTQMGAMATREVGEQVLASVVLGAVVKANKVRYRDKIDELVASSKPSQRDLGNLPKRPTPPRTSTTHTGYQVAPTEITGIPGLTRARGRTPVQGGGGFRRRWMDADGNVYEWDSQHGTLEKYNSNGTHLGEYDPGTGLRTKDADPSRNIRRYL